MVSKLLISQPPEMVLGKPFLYSIGIFDYETTVLFSTNCTCPIYLVITKKKRNTTVTESPYEEVSKLFGSKMTCSFCELRISLKKYDWMDVVIILNRLNHRYIVSCLFHSFFSRMLICYICDDQPELSNSC